MLNNIYNTLVLIFLIESQRSANPAQQTREEYSTHAILFGDVTAFVDKIYCWFLRHDCENVDTL